MPDRDLRAVLLGRAIRAVLLFPAPAGTPHTLTLYSPTNDASQPAADFANTRLLPAAKFCCRSFAASCPMGAASFATVRELWQQPPANLSSAP